MVRCSCGRVELEATGAPIMCAVCHCDDCQEGARRIEACGQLQDAAGGTAYVLYRKDRVRWSKGAELLQGHKLKDKSPTNRMIATCCNSAMLMSFDRGPYWVSVYRDRFQDDVPPVEMRVNTKFIPAGAVLPNDGVPAYATASVKFVAKLIAGKIAMMLGR
jgi:hypothetical protein